MCSHCDRGEVWWLWSTPNLIDQRRDRRRQTHEGESRARGSFKSSHAWCLRLTTIDRRGFWQGLRLIVVSHWWRRQEVR
jgi:hypothetical protein